MLVKILESPNVRIDSGDRELTNNRPRETLQANIQLGRYYGSACVFRFDRLGQQLDVGAQASAFLFILLHFLHDLVKIVDDADESLHSS